MAEIVQSLFGLTPEMYQQRQEDLAGERALRFAELTPMQQANYAIGRGAYGLAGAIGGALGGTDPELQRRTVSQQILGMIDPNRPETFDQAAQMAKNAGIPQLAFGLLEESDKWKQKALVRQSKNRTNLAQDLITKSFIPGQQLTVMIDENGQPVTIPERPASFNINPVLQQLMALGTEGRAAITEQASLLPSLRKLGASSMREENPFVVFTNDPTLPKIVQTLAAQYSKSFVSGMIDPEKADVRVKELADMAQRVQQFDQNQAQIKANQETLVGLRAQGLENSRQGLLIQQGNQVLASQNAAFQRDMKIAEADRKAETARNKPLPPHLAKGEEADYDTAQAATNLASDANNFINRIKSGEIKFGLKERASLFVRQFSGAPDVIAREDYDKFLKVLVNESLRLNKGTQTEGDAVRAAKELESSESPQSAASAMRRLVDINVRRVQDASKSVDTRRQNANFPAASRPIDVPVLEYQVIDDADYQRFAKNPRYPSGTIFIDPAGVRRKKP